MAPNRVWRNMGMEYVAIALGGFVGAILRFGVSEWLGTINGVNIATLLTNWSGCFALAWLNTVTMDRLPIHPYLRLGLSTGMIGAFTTFSTFTIDAWKLFENGQVVSAMGYVLLSLLGGFFSTYLGYQLGRLETRTTIR